MSASNPFDFAAVLARGALPDLLAAVLARGGLVFLFDAPSGRAAVTFFFATGFARLAVTFFAISTDRGEVSTGPAISVRTLLPWEFSVEPGQREWLVWGGRYCGSLRNVK
ncbi:MAG: hypothetical protein CME15_05925 [Gemmatimonadetes bacterium]|nr:hypothetical protein [Gemmatimonadota bacterium]